MHDRTPSGYRLTRRIASRDYLSKEAMVEFTCVACGRLRVPRAPTEREELAARQLSFPLEDVPTCESCGEPLPRS